MEEKIIELRNKNILHYFEYKRNNNNENNENNNNEKRKYLICCPGWLCSAELLISSLKEITELTNYILIGIEWRGHGKSKVKFGNKVTVDNLSEDLFYLIEYIKQNSSNSSSICLLGHSMGVNVVWRYIDKYGENYIDRYIFLDQPPAIVGTPNANQVGYKNEWKIHTKFEVYCLSFLCLIKNYFIIPLLERYGPLWMRGSFLNYAKLCNSYSCSQLLIDTTFTDNTKRISIIKKPCLVYGGEASFVNPDVAHWIIRQLKCPTKLLIYPKPYGTHFPFILHENDIEKVGPKRLINDISLYLLTDT